MFFDRSVIKHTCNLTSAFRYEANDVKREDALREAEHRGKGTTSVMTDHERC